MLPEFSSASTKTILPLLKKHNLHYMYTYIHIYIFIWMHTDTYFMYINMYIHTYVHTYMYLSMDLWIYLSFYLNKVSFDFGTGQQNSKHLYSVDHQTPVQEIEALKFSMFSVKAAKQKVVRWKLLYKVKLFQTGLGCTNVNLFRWAPRDNIRNSEQSNVSMPQVIESLKEWTISFIISYSKMTAREGGSRESEFNH